MPAQPLLGGAVRGRHQRDQQQRGQRARDEKGMAAHPGQNSARKGFAGGRGGQGQVGRGGGEHRDSVVAPEDNVPPPTRDRVDGRDREHRDEDQERRSAEDVGHRSRDVGGRSRSSENQGDDLRTHEHERDQEQRAEEPDRRLAKFAAPGCRVAQRGCVRVRVFDHAAPPDAGLCN